MPRRKIPAYRRHKHSGQAIVTFNGRDHYLGRHGSKASRDAYDALVAEWLSSGRTSASFTETLTVVELLAAYWKFAKSYYPTPGGKLGGELWNIRGALRRVKDLYGRTEAESFGPVALKAVRQKMVDEGLARSTINLNVNRIRRAFRWAASEELIPANVVQSLDTVAGLRAGKTKAKEPEAVQPVSEADVERTLPHLSEVVRAMVELQRVTGARPGEICAIRPADVDRSGEVWLYRPQSHKNAHRGKSRTICLGPRAQAALRPYLLRPKEEYCFQPREAEQKRRAEAHMARKTPIGEGNRPGTNVRRSPKKQPGDRYNTGSYCRAITRACSKGDVPHWTPNQLRHSVATRVRAQFGLEATQLILGHSHAKTSEIYAETSLARAAEVARAIG